MKARHPVGAAFVLLFLATVAWADKPAARNRLDPVGRIHIPIGIANTVDTLKTFVEAEGVFSPGCGSYGVYFWLFDPASGRLVAPTMEGVRSSRGLSPEGYLTAWTRWSGGQVEVRTTVGEVQRPSPAGPVFVVGAKAALTNHDQRERSVALYVALRPLGPAGFAVREISAAETADALLVEGHPALVCNQKPSALGVVSTDSIGPKAIEGKMPTEQSARSPSGDCSGAVRYDLCIPPGKTVELGFVCPVLPGRRAKGHQWDGKSAWAQFDLNRPNPAHGGSLQPDPGLDYYRQLSADALLAEARAYWQDLAGRLRVVLPDRRWAQALAAILGHAAMAMNEDAPDVAVLNYNVFNRDGVYVANILQKAGRLDLAERAIGYFLRHPFNGRVQVEADNPGQILWAMGEHWLLSRDRQWLDRVYPSAAKIAAMIRYYRTTPGPHYVKAESLEFGDALPADRPDDRPAQRRQVLRPGSCDGTNPNYTEAFDVAGMRAAALLARAAGKEEDARQWDALAGTLMDLYDQRFGQTLAKGYGSFSVLWPCRLYPFREGKAHEQFRGIGAQGPTGWRYFPLATAHQGLLAGNREAGCGTLEKHLAHEQMVGWYAFDEGGGSGEGGWRHYRTTWRPGVAMPHGWAIAELWLLMRDCLAFEDDQRLVLLGGVPAEWFTAKEAMSVENLPTYFGPLGFTYRFNGDTPATLTLTGAAAPPQGFVLRLPRRLKVAATADGKPLRQSPSGDLPIPANVTEVKLVNRVSPDSGKPAGPR